MSAYVLARALPSENDRFAALVEALRDDANRRFALAELNDFLSMLGAAEFAAAVLPAIDLRGLSPMVQNYVAAMVEQAASARAFRSHRGLATSSRSTNRTSATPLKSLRLHLLRATPVAFKRRNIFADAGVGARV